MKRKSEQRVANKSQKVTQSTHLRSRVERRDKIFLEKKKFVQTRQVETSCQEKIKKPKSFC